MKSFDKDKLDELLRKLEELPKIKEVISLKKRLERELVKKEPKSEPIISKEEIKISANKTRSSKQKMYWRYIKLIRDNFPHLPTKEIRRQLKERRQGNQTEISDAIWQNPSP